MFGWLIGNKGKRKRRIIQQSNPIQLTKLLLSSTQLNIAVITKEKKEEEEEKKKKKKKEWATYCVGIHLFCNKR